MASDINSDLRAELEAAKDVVEKEVRGQRNMENDPLMAGLKDSITAKIAEGERRISLLETAIGEIDGLQEALDELYADGYPDFPPMAIPADQYAALTAEVSDIAAGASAFVAEPSATSMSITFTPVDA